jgi:hypothetical protein
MIERDEITERYAALDEAHRQPVDDYNFAHFRPKHFLIDVRRTIDAAGIQPGERAPDFEMPHIGTQETLRLSDLRGKPVLLHFGSFT